MHHAQLIWLTNFIWNVADDVLRDVYARGKYRDVVLPMALLRGLDSIKAAVMEMKAALDKECVTNQDAALRAAPGQESYDTSPILLRDLKSSATEQKLKDDFEACLGGFSPNGQDILTNFEFRKQIPPLSKADALGPLNGKFLDPDINLSPDPVLNDERTVKHPGMHNRSMGTVCRGTGPQVQRRDPHDATASFGGGPLLSGN